MIRFPQAVSTENTGDKGIDDFGYIVVCLEKYFTQEKSTKCIKKFIKCVTSLFNKLLRLMKYLLLNNIISSKADLKKSEIVISVLRLPVRD